ncbi:MAG: FCD domain-containing protein [Propionibacteriales bacterium]|nr:FCD domain-containing protein [Propionibacteriales bacterium]
MAARRTVDDVSAMTAGVQRRSPYAMIKNAILTGELMPGQQLVESTLARWCDMSRTPIREALTRLEQDGLVIRNERGLIVRERNPEEILDIYETRVVLEATAARVASERRSKIDVINLKRVADRLERLETDDENLMAEGNREFHQAVWRASHNEPLIDLLSRLDLHLTRYPATTLSQPGRWTEANGEHRRLIDAIEGRDAARAGEVATAHFTKARDLRLALWAESQG